MLNIEPDESSKHITVILGHLFLTIANATVLNMRVRIDIFKACSKHSFEDESERFFIDVIDEMVEEAFPTKDAMEVIVSHTNLESFDITSSV